MQSSFGLVKKVTPLETATAAAPAVASPAAKSTMNAGALEFVRMVGVAAVSGLFFSLVAGLVVYLVASHGNLDPRSPQEVQQISTAPVTERP